MVSLYPLYKIIKFFCSNLTAIAEGPDLYSSNRTFRDKPASCHIRVNPMFHWTDSKIRCHLLTCVIALACLRLLEIKAGDKHTAKSMLEEMEQLDCLLSWQHKETTPQVHIEDPTEFQAGVLASLGYQIKDGSVLQISA